VWGGGVGGETKVWAGRRLWDGDGGGDNDGAAQIFGESSASQPMVARLSDPSLTAYLNLLLSRLTLDTKFVTALAPCLGSD
jgi:hypothetical protein